MSLNSLGSLFPTSQSLSLNGNLLSLIPGGSSVNLTGTGGSSADWSQFPATQAVDFASYDLANVSTINGQPIPSTAGLVPYTGATADLDLSGFDLSCNNVNANTINGQPIPSTAGLVPYTGATADLDLSGFDLSCNDITCDNVLPQTLAVKDVNLIGSDQKFGYATRFDTITFPSGNQTVQVFSFDFLIHTSGTYHIEVNTGEGNMGGCIVQWQAQLPVSLSITAGAITGGYFQVSALPAFDIEYVYSGHASSGNGFVFCTKFVVDP